MTHIITPLQDYLFMIMYGIIWITIIFVLSIVLMIYYMSATIALIIVTVTHHLRRVLK